MSFAPHPASLSNRSILRRTMSSEIFARRYVVLAGAIPGRARHLRQW